MPTSINIMSTLACQQTYYAWLAGVEKRHVLWPFHDLSISFVFHPMEVALAYFVFVSSLYIGFVKALGSTKMQANEQSLWGHASSVRDTETF